MHKYCETKSSFANAVYNILLNIVTTGAQRNTIFSLLFETRKNVFYRLHPMLYWTPFSDIIAHENI